MKDENNNAISLKIYVDTRFDAIILNASQRFDAQQLALKDALLAQEKGTSLALVNTEKAIDKAAANTDKRFDELSDKISTAIDSINKSTGASAIYVTHTDLSSEMEKLRVSFEGMLRPVVTFMNSQNGKSDEGKNIWAYVVTAISLIISIILFALRLGGK
jgi:N-methylhydantoinase B/oxoprolinase/acetone carboxylase alpha subunit